MLLLVLTVQTGLAAATVARESDGLDTVVWLPAMLAAILSLEG